jgi:hypothetical protein
MPSIMTTVTKFFLCILFAISSNVGFSQAETSEGIVSSVFKLNFFMPGASYEQKITTNQTLHFSTYMDVSFLSQTSNDNTQFSLLFSPVFSVGFRNYYNIKTRAERGLRTYLNSANYIAPVYLGRYTLSSEYAENLWINQVGAVWGFQRTSPKGFSFDLNLGAAYVFKNRTSNNYNTIEPIIQLALGFRLGHKSK